MSDRSGPPRGSTAPAFSEPPASTRGGLTDGAEAELPVPDGAHAHAAAPARVGVRPIADAGEPPDSFLMVDEPGTFLGKHGERLRVTLKGEVVAERPLVGLEHVFVLAGGVSLSADAIRLCAEQGIPISFISRSGSPYAVLMAPRLTGTVQTRRQQLLAFQDARGMHLARAFASGKLVNQATLLKYVAKYRQRTNAVLYQTVREAAYELEDLSRRILEVPPTAPRLVRAMVMSLEARGARHYWEAARLLVTLPAGVPWTGRETRGAPDLVNQCLNYGYGILYAHVERAVLLAGLDPYAGFLHEDRPGKPSLVLDLVEEFRAHAVDRCVFALLNQRAVLMQDPEGQLDDATRHLLAERVNERLETPEPYEGRRPRLRSIMQLQARRIATYVRGESGPYTAWQGRW